MESIEHDGSQRDDLRNERHGAAAASSESSRGKFSEEQGDYKNEAKREKRTERVGAVENGGGDENDGQTEVLVGDIVRHVAHDERQTHSVEQRQRHHQLDLRRRAEQRQRRAQTHRLNIRKTAGGDVKGVVLGGLGLVRSDAGYEHEAEEGDNGGNGEDRKENFVVHVGEHRFDQTADQCSHTAGELENGEEQTIVFACHVGETWSEKGEETLLLDE